MLITFGCSNTYGTSLVDRTQAWPYLLDKDVDNQAIAGSSNLQILWTILNYKFKVTDTVIIMWAIVNRDYMFPDIQLGVWQNTELANDWKRLYSEHDSVVKSWLYIQHANLFLQSKNIKTYNFAVDYDLLNKYKPTNINTTLLNCNVDIHKFMDRASDGMHPGPTAHNNIANEIRKFL